MSKIRTVKYHTHLTPVTRDLSTHLCRVWLWGVRLVHGQPVGVGGVLSLELSLKRLQDVGETERTHGRTRDTVAEGENNHGSVITE